MKRSILTVLAIISACTATAMAEEYNGALSVGGSYSNISGQKAKFNEYKNLGSGAQVGLDLNYRGDSGYYWSGLADFSLMNGRSLDDAVTTDMNFNFKTGKTDVFKASLFYNEITHNITDNARTFQSGIGTSVLSGPTPTATNFVNSFDYGIKRKNYGAEAEVSLKSPFFFLTHVERNEAKGLLPMSIRDTTTIEAPAPIDYATDTLFLQTGYRSKEIIFTIDGSISKFNNDNTAFSSYVNNVRTFAYLPPNNESYSIGGALMYKIPVFDSVLMVRASNVLTDSSFQFRESIPAGRPTWNGKVQDTSASIALTSRPLSKLSTNIWYKYYGHADDSDQAFTYGGYNTKPFNYHKNNAGLDLNYQLPAKTKISLGYEYNKTDRTLTYPRSTSGSFSGSPETIDNIVYVQAKNNLLDWITAKVRYQRLIREGNFDYRTSVANSGATSEQLVLNRPVAYASKIQDKIKTGLDLDPIDNLGISIDYSWIQNNYMHTGYGVKGDFRHAVNFDTTYTFGITKLNAFADVEFIRTESLFYLPGSYRWASTRRDMNYDFGTKADFELIKGLLSFSTTYRYERADGTNEFSKSVAPVPTDVPYLDDYIKHSADAKLSYNMSKALKVDVGYLYEHLKYSDTAYAQYTIGGNNFTGAYANPNYDASVVYTKLTYKF